MNRLKQLASYFRNRLKLAELKSKLKTNMMDEQTAYRDRQDADKRIIQCSNSHNHLISQIHAVESALENK